MALADLLARVNNRIQRCRAHPSGSSTHTSGARAHASASGASADVSGAPAQSRNALAAPTATTVSTKVTAPVSTALSLSRSKRRFQKLLQAARGKLAKAPVGAESLSQLLDGLLVFFKAKAGGGGCSGESLSWTTALRIAFSPAAVAARHLSDIAFGGHVGEETVRRVKIRFASGLQVAAQARCMQLLQDAALRRGSSSSSPVLLVGQLWKWDDTEVRWRTLVCDSSSSFGSTSLVQRGWLLFRHADGTTHRYPVPCPVVSLPSKRPEDLWVNLRMPLSTHHPLAQQLAQSVAVLMMFVFDAASSNKKCCAHELAGRSGATFVVSALCLAHQIHLCSRSQFLGLGANFVTKVARSGRLWQISKYRVELVDSVLNSIRSRLHIVRPQEHCPQFGGAPVEAQRSVLKSLLSAMRGGLTPQVEAAADVVADLLNDDWEDVTTVRHFCTGPACCHGSTLDEIQDAFMAKLGPALRQVFSVAGSVAREARWTDTFAGVAGQALWLLIHNSGPHAMGLRWPDKQRRHRLRWRLHQCICMIA